MNRLSRFPWLQSLLNSPLLQSLVMIFSVAGFYLVGHYLFGRDQAKSVIDSLLIGALLTNVLVYRRAALGHIRAGFQDGSANIIVSNWLQSLTLILYFIWVVSFSLLGRPDDLRASPIGGVLDSLILVAVFTSILVPMNEKVPLEKIAVKKLWIYALIGAFVSGVLVTLSLMNAPIF